MNLLTVSAGRYQSWRVNAGLSQIELGKILGFGSGQFVSNIERGLARLPLASFRAAAKAFDVPIEELIADRVETEKKLIERVLLPKKAKKQTF